MCNILSAFQSITYRIYVSMGFFSLQIRQYLKSQDLKNEGKTKEETFYDGVVKDVLRRNDADRDGTLSVKEYNVYGHDEL